MSDKSFLLSELTFKEFLSDKLNWEIGPIKFGNFNLIVGDNAQGKTRLFNILARLKDVITTGRAVNNPDWKCEYRLLFFEEDNDEIINRISYDIDISVNRITGVPDYVESIRMNDKTLFDRKKPLLYKEAELQPVSDFFLPSHVPVVLTLPQTLSPNDFPTFRKIRSFFERALFLEGNHIISNQTEIPNISSQSMVVNANGSNIAPVILNWKTHVPVAYKELKSAFIDCFSTVEGASLDVKISTLPGVNIPIPVLSFQEKNVEKNIQQSEWSDGMLRSMCLLALPISRFVNPDGTFLRPSMICVDEVENGLDYKTAKRLISLFQDHSNLMQVMLISHSPTICNMVPTQDWRITKRSGSKVSFFTPNEKEADIDKLRLSLHQDNWEFYRTHIAKSPLYSVKTGD